MYTRNGCVIVGIDRAFPIDVRDDAARTDMASSKTLNARLTVCFGK